MKSKRSIASMSTDYDLNSFKEHGVTGSKVLLTGGTGFVGSHLAEKLLKAGSDLRCLVRSGSRYKQLEENGAEIVFGNFEDTESLKQAVKDCEIIFHLAGATRAFTRENLFTINVDGTRRLVEASLEEKKIKRFVYVSSLAVCGPSITGFLPCEHDSGRPVSSYGESKLEGEKIVRASTLPWVVVRPPAVYGPRDRDMLLFFQLASHRLSVRLGKMKRTVSLIYVKDLADGLILSADSIPNEIFFLSDGRTYTWNEVMQCISDLFNKRTFQINVPFCVLKPAALLSEIVGHLKKSPVIFNRDKVRELACAHWVCSSKKAQEKIGFKPSHTLKEGFRETVNWYRKNGWI